MRALVAVSPTIKTRQPNPKLIPGKAAMELQQEIRDLIEHVQLLQQNARPMERQTLRNTTELLELCAVVQPQACIIEILRIEIGEQRSWIMDYLKQQAACQDVIVPFDGLTETSEDHEILLLRYCQETLEGAKAIALGLDVALLPEAWKVRHRKNLSACSKGQSHTNGGDVNSAPVAAMLPAYHSPGDSTVLERV